MISLNMENCVYKEYKFSEGTCFCCLFYWFFFGCPCTMNAVLFNLIDNELVQQLVSVIHDTTVKGTHFVFVNSMLNDFYTLVIENGVKC